QPALLPGAGTRIRVRKGSIRVQAHPFQRAGQPSPSLTIGHFSAPSGGVTSISEEKPSWSRLLFKMDFPSRRCGSELHAAGRLSDALRPVPSMMWLAPQGHGYPSSGGSRSRIGQLTDACRLRLTALEPSLR